MTDPYDVLGVGRHASRDDVRAAYRRLARRWHPDVHGSADVSLRRQAEQRMRELNGAYDAIVSGRAARSRRPGYAGRTSYGGPTVGSWSGFRTAFHETVRADGDRFASWYVGAGPTLVETLRDFRDILLGRQSPPMTVEQVARRLRTSPRAVARLVERGLLQTQVVAGVVRISADALAGYLYGRIVSTEARRP